MRPNSPRRRDAGDTVVSLAVILCQSPGPGAAVSCMYSTCTSVRAWNARRSDALRSLLLPHGRGGERRRRWNAARLEASSWDGQSGSPGRAVATRPGACRSRSASPAGEDFGRTKGGREEKAAGR